MDQTLLMKQMFNFLFCCLSEEEQETVYAKAVNTPETVYEAQQNLNREKRGYRCGICGTFYPHMELTYQDDRTEPDRYAKMKGTLRKGKKSALIFGKDHYYAKYKKSLLKFEADSDGVFQETDAVPVRADICHSIISDDGKYIATDSLGDTIEVIDVSGKQRIAKKQSTPINGNFIFTKDNKVLYFFKEAIRLWDFRENTDSVVWAVPEEWKASEDKNARFNIVCTNCFYNGKENAYFFVLHAGGAMYAVSVKNTQISKIVQLSNAPVYHTLVFEENSNRYTLPTEENVIIYDSDFQIVETIVPPRIVKHHDGGGFFPVSQHWIRCPNEVFLSPNEKWLLLNYHGTIVLMRHEDLSIRFCHYSHTGKTANLMGFVDSKHFWYTCGDTTYIQEIAE